jgi:hypothetical protein
MGSRYYDPALGRFIQPDSLIPEAYNPLAYDRYQYVYSNPVRFNDPSGHCIDGVSTWVCLAVAGAAIGAASGYIGQVINNLNNGYNLGEAATTNISAEPIVTGAVLGFTAVVAAPAVMAGAGDILVGAGVATSSTALFGAGIGAYETAATIEHFYSYGTTLPVLEFDSKQFPNIAPHIQDAQKAGQPSVLTRTTNPVLMGNNRAAATGGVSGLDEYPFASTYQGGAGASVRNVPAAENRLQGLRIANFYWRNKIGDGDKFMVKGR